VCVSVCVGGGGRAIWPKVFVGLLLGQFVGRNAHVAGSTTVTIAMPRCPEENRI
jgi:hypothetical protein